MWPSIVCSWLLLSTSSATSDYRPIPSPVVTVKNGSYSGVYNAYYNQDFFLGVPYAQPPVKDLRYRVPHPLNTTWESLKPATAYAPFCVGYGSDDLNHKVSEDCLYVSIVRPHGIPQHKTLPVAVWIHGGGLIQGGSNDPRYNLSYIVQNSVEMNVPMLAVSVQYRLSGWGFLGGKEALEGGATNLGYRDQRRALEWIQENIGAFGGDRTKVTIWGESAGAESVGVQLLAYNGRDDSLFRGAIAESGGPSNLFFPLNRGYNSTTPQLAYDILLNLTSCSSLPCLRTLPFDKLNTIINSSLISGVLPYASFAPVLDGDIIHTYPSIQLDRGDFVKVPFLIGANTNEGTAFGPKWGTGINTDADFLSNLNTTCAITGFPAHTLLALYPALESIGIPSWASFPIATTPNSTIASTYGLQTRRVNAFYGDIEVHSPRRATSLAWSAASTPLYSYRFDVTPSPLPPFVGATHFQEVAFVFNNTGGAGYFAADPFANASAAAFELAVQMSRSWVGFITGLDPNRHGLRGKNVWPVYNASAGGGVGENFVWTVEGESYVEADTYRAQGIGWVAENALEVFGR